MGINGLTWCSELELQGKVSKYGDLKKAYEEARIIPLKY
jgi:hypothetical protein